jgi:hypothetical protein
MKAYVQAAAALIMLTIAAVFLSIVELVTGQKPVEGDEHCAYSWII